MQQKTTLTTNTLREMHANAVGSGQRSQTHMSKKNELK